MDNLTHSFTGGLAAKVSEHYGITLTLGHRRLLFWLFVFSANIPDIDVALNLVADPLFSITHHRGVTHSILFAPFFALIIAAPFYYLGSLRNFRALWTIALTGILIHICFDLITAFGTQIFAPLRETRYSLDWMFIIDPVFTGSLGTLLVFGKIFSRFARVFTIAATVFAGLYLGAEFISHTIALNRVDEAVKRELVAPMRMSALPQPLSIFEWNGLVQTQEAVYQVFFSILNDEPLHFTRFDEARGPLVEKALATHPAGLYMKFARHPLITEEMEGDTTVVIFKDLLFSVDQAIVQSVGFTERSLPFMLRYYFSGEGNLMHVTFDGKNIEGELRK